MNAYGICVLSAIISLKCALVGTARLCAGLSAKMEHSD